MTDEIDKSQHRSSQANSAAPSSRCGNGGDGGDGGPGNDANYEPFQSRAVDSHAYYEPQYSDYCNVLLSKISRTTGRDKSYISKKIKAYQPLKSMIRKYPGLNISGSKRNTYTYTVTLHYLAQSIDIMQQSCPDADLSRLDLDQFMQIACESINKHFIDNALMLASAFKRCEYACDYDAARLISIFTLFDFHFTLSASHDVFLHDANVVLKALDPVTRNTSLTPAIKTAAAQYILLNTRERHFNALLTPGGEIPLHLKLARLKPRAKYNDYGAINSDMLNTIHAVAAQETAGFVRSMESSRMVEKMLIQKLAECGARKQQIERLLSRLRERVDFGLVLAIAQRNLFSAQENRQQNNVRPFLKPSQIRNFMLEPVPRHLKVLFGQLLDHEQQFNRGFIGNQYTSKVFIAAENALDSAILQAFLGCNASLAEQLLGRRTNDRAKDIARLEKQPESAPIGASFSALYKAINRYRQDHSPEWHASLTG